MKLLYLTPASSAQPKRKIKENKVCKSTSETGDREGNQGSQSRTPPPTHADCVDLEGFLPQRLSSPSDQHSHTDCVDLESETFLPVDTPVRSVIELPAPSPLPSPLISSSVPTPVSINSLPECPVAINLSRVTIPDPPNEPAPVAYHHLHNGSTLSSERKFKTRIITVPISVIMPLKGEESNRPVVPTGSAALPKLPKSFPIPEKEVASTVRIAPPVVLPHPTVQSPPSASGGIPKKVIPNGPVISARSNPSCLPPDGSTMLNKIKNLTRLPIPLPLPLIQSLPKCSIPLKRVEKRVSRFSITLPPAPKPLPLLPQCVVRLEKIRTPISNGPTPTVRSDPPVRSCSVMLEQIPLQEPRPHPKPVIPAVTKHQNEADASAVGETRGGSTLVTVTKTSGPQHGSKLFRNCHFPGCTFKTHSASSFMAHRKTHYKHRPAYKCPCGSFLFKRARFKQHIRRKNCAGFNDQGQLEGAELNDYCKTRIRMRVMGQSTNGEARHQLIRSYQQNRKVSVTPNRQKV